MSRLARRPAATGFVAAGALLMIVAGLVIHAVLRGPWLDEFWTLHLSDPRQGLGVLVRDGWLRDTHPPLFNLWATVLSAIGVTSIPVARLVSNLPAFGLVVGAALHLSRRMPEQTGFHLGMLLLVFSLPQAVESFANYRSYFWQICALATLVLVARHIVLSADDLYARRDRLIAGIAVGAIVGAVALHYVGGVLGAAFAAAVAVTAFATGRRRWAILILLSAGASGVFVVIMGMLQVPNWAVDLDHRWLEAESVPVLLPVAALAVGAIRHNPISLLGLWIGRRTWSRRDVVFMAALAGALLVATATWLAINAWQPVIIARYLFSVPVLVCAGMAALAVKFADDWRLFGLLALVSVGMVIAPLFRHGAKPLWAENARTIAAIVADCPSTQVHAASGWLLRPGGSSRAARREDPVFERGYRRLAESFGFKVRMVDRDLATPVEPGACPVLLWIEHTPARAEDRPDLAISAAGLQGLEGASLSVVRSGSGLILRADRP